MQNVQCSLSGPGGQKDTQLVPAYEMNPEAYQTQCCAAGPQSAVPAVRSTRGAVRGPVLRVLRLNILWYLFI